MEGGIESIRRTERAREFFMQNTEDYKNKKGVCFHALLKDVGREECSSCINKKVLALGRNPFCRT